MAFLIASAILLLLVILASILVKASFRANIDEDDKPLSLIRITEVVATILGTALILYFVEDKLLKYTLSTALVVGMLLTRSVTAHLLSNILKPKNSAYNFEQLSDANSLDIVKKYEVSKITNKKGIYFFTGLFISLVFTTLVIEYKTIIEIATVAKQEMVFIEDDIIDIPLTNMPPPPPPQPKVTPVIKEVPDETLLEKPEIKIVPDEKVEERTYTDYEPAEEKIEEDNSIFDLFQLQQPPQFPGGMGAVLSYISQNFVMSSRDAEEGNKGKIIVQFVVEKNGAIGDVKVLRGINTRLDGEAVRVIKSMPKWSPGMNAGAPVRVRYMVPVNIQ